VFGHTTTGPLLFTITLMPSSQLILSPSSSFLSHVLGLADLTADLGFKARDPDGVYAQRRQRERHPSTTPTTSITRPIQLHRLQGA
jgi:hypothetical protein